MLRIAKKLCYSLIAILLILAAFMSNATDSFWTPTGIWSILPPLVAILLAFLTKNVIVSLLVGVFCASFLLALQTRSPGMATIAFFDVATRQMRDAVAKPWNAGVLLQCGAIGGLVGLITANGGVRAVAEALSKLARGPRSAQLISWFLGFFIFFDDYANVQIRGPIMRPISDRNGVSREKFAFILDSTSAPIAGIALISTWIGTEVSYINAGLNDAGLTGVSPYSLFVESIPFRFYNVLTIVFVLLTALTLREFGSMRRAEILARKGYLRELDSRLIRREEAERYALDESRDPDEAEGSASRAPTSKRGSLLGDSMLALVPLATLVVAAFAYFFFSGRAKILAGGTPELPDVARSFSFDSFRACVGQADASIAIFQAAVLAGVVAFVMSALSGRLSASEASRAWIGGVKSLAFTFVILILAWSLATCIGKDGLGTARFLVSTLSSSTPAPLLSTFIFALAAVVSFATGTSYGTMAIITPLAIPFANEIAPGDHAYLVAATSAVLTGAIFGDHCSPISDTTILSSNGARCGLLEHVSTQLGYALWIAAISILFGFLPVGYGVSLWVALPVSLAVLCVLLLVLGRKTPEKIDDDLPALHKRRAQTKI